ncbi:MULTISPECIES: hypothetical protein [Caloramator]|jgi:hypothetical protein|uniref:Uncharacterized protein n=1 Tax=Caloramator australicus RC3 TaxID=857293 RepID=I7J6K2_9CLOT|nr:MULTISPECIES: hypothetical protein [Caloramator]MDO6354515.1 hypothetical protein [Caloramator sp. CAR-1]CCJ34574.1 hypothetical protein CAAU_2491 [Caloramator australicus RC3]
MKKIKLFLKILIIILTIGVVFPLLINSILVKNHNINKDDAIFVVNYGLDDKGLLDIVKKIINIPR